MLGCALWELLDEIFIRGAKPDSIPAIAWWSQFFCRKRVVIALKRVTALRLKLLLEYPTSSPLFLLLHRHRLMNSPPPTSGASTSPTEYQSPKRKVLVVDDNQDLAEAAVLFLQASGHDVRAAHDGPTALRLVKDFQLNVAVVDISLPGMDGNELALRLRELVPDLALVALSGWRIDPGDGRASKSGFSAYLIPHQARGSREVSPICPRPAPPKLAS